MIFDRFFLLLIVAIANSCCTVSLNAIVRHPFSDSKIAFMDHPSDKVVGKWGYNSSCVAIGPDLVITTKHQKGGVGTKVSIDGRQYTVQNVLLLLDIMRLNRMSELLDWLMQTWIVMFV